MRRTLLVARLLRLRLGRRILLPALFGLLTFVLYCFVGPSVTYCNVGAPVGFWGQATDLWTCSNFLNVWPPDHVIHEGRLYLRVQTVRHSPLLVSFVGFGGWDAGKINKFRHSHPELEGYWPNPGQADGGVQWALPD
jgi:hypothetical protein